MAPTARQRSSGDGSGAGPVPGVRRRARLDPQERRAQIVSVAREVLEQQGTTALGIDEVADAAGVSRSLVYAYFGDRDGLVAELYIALLEDLDHQLGPTMPSDRAGLERIIAGCMAFAHHHPASWRLLANDPVRQHPTIEHASSARVERLAAGMGGGDDVLFIAQAALGLVTAGVLHWVDHSGTPAQEAAGLLASLLWHGLDGTSLDGDRDRRAP